MSELSERLKKLRKERKLTQKQVSSKTNIAERQYQSYEYGKNIPLTPILIALADYFDVSLDYLVGRSDDPKRY